MYGKVGVQSLSDGAGGPIRIDARGNISTARGGKYSEATLAGRMFAVANQAAVITTAAMALTYTGLAVCNPLTSGKKAIIHGFSYGVGIAVPVATSIGIMAGTGCAAATAIIAIQNRLVGGGDTTAMVADDAVVFTAAPVLHQLVAIGWEEAVTAGSLSGPHGVDLDGSLILMPGAFVAAYTSEIVTGAALLFSFLWEEVDV